MSEAPSWADDLAATLDQVWQVLGRGVADAKSPARYPVLATIGRDGPEARTVGLRRAERSKAEVEIHTDTAAHKVAQLRADPRAALHVWLPRMDTQLRLRCAATVLTRPETGSRWASIPPAGRINYGGTPPTGDAILAPDAYEKAPDPDRFCAVVLAVREVDVVLLTEDRHRRSLFRAADGFAGTWLAP